MKIVVYRHAEVDFCWNKRCTSDGFDSDCGEYNKAPIKKGKYRIPRIRYQRIYISRLSRSRHTAEELFPGDDYFETRFIDEVPLRSSFDTKKRIPLWFWNISGRLQWFMNSKRQVEGRNQTRKRARRFVLMINKENVDCVVITHGFFMYSLLHELKKAGFRMNKSSLKYINGDYIIADNDE